MNIETRSLKKKARFAALPLIAVVTAVATSASPAWAGPDPAAPQYLPTARAYYAQGQFFRAARYAFAALENETGNRGEAYSWISMSLVRAKLYNAASYFFIKTLESGDRNAIRHVLGDAEPLLQNVGADLLRKYLVKNTSLDDYTTGANRSALFYALGKDALLTGREGHGEDEEKAIHYLSGVSNGSALWPFALELRATAYALHGDANRAIEDFGGCASNASQIEQGLDSDSARYRQAKSEAEDLAARCLAGKARTYYQANQFDAADQAYDRIQKSSIVWPDILFEQAWNSFARGEFNRTLGKLVSYKSPALSFVFNPEVDVLRAQSYLALCLYEDASQVVTEFGGKYSAIGEDVKRFVEGHSNDLGAFFEKGSEVLHAPISTGNDFNRLVNRFARGPYFAGLVRSERDIWAESQVLQQFDRMQAGVSHDPGRGFPGFLNQVLAWRQKSVRLLGGMFVKNSMLDYHSELISNFEKVSFIQLEMLKRAKDQLVYKHSGAPGRLSGSVIPTRRSYQYYWSFNGEFWGDELGDYVFGLESQCRVGGAT